MKDIKVEGLTVEDARVFIMKAGGKPSNAAHVLALACQWIAESTKGLAGAWDFWTSMQRNFQGAQLNASIGEKKYREQVNV